MPPGCTWHAKVTRTCSPPWNARGSSTTLLSTAQRRIHMNNHEVPPCPDFSSECLGGGLDIHLHVSPEGNVEVVSCTPSACSEDSPYDFWQMLRERGFRAFAVRALEDEMV